MKPPIEPSKEDCCNSGCNPCIFDVYEKQLKLYEKYLESGVFNESDDNGISQQEYTSFVVIDNIHFCESHRLIAFKKFKSDIKRVWWKAGDHFLIKYTSLGKTCTRAYTPVKLKINSCKDVDFAILVKRYENGLVSNYLFNLKPGEQTMWRGPYGNYVITPNKYDRIIMIAQGTGVAPFVSIIENILNNEEDMTKINLLLCCESIDKILFRDQLYSYNSYWNFKYEIFLSNISEEVPCKYQEPISHHRLCFEDLTKLKPFIKNEQFLICGSAKFMEQYSMWLKNEVSLENIKQF